MDIAFAAPMALAGLLGLPLLFWLLRVTPPRPREVFFPPTKILRELIRDKETPSKSPWWLLALRLALAAALILAAAGPAVEPVNALVTQATPTLLVMDDGWTAAPDWEKRIGVAATLAEAAGRIGAPLAVTAISDTAAPTPMDGARALEKIRAMRPQPFLPDRAAVAGHVREFARAYRNSRIVWLSDAIANGGAADFAQALTDAAAAGAQVTTIAGAHDTMALVAPVNDSRTLAVDVLRANVGDAAPATVIAEDRKGQEIGRAQVNFGVQTRATAQFDLPVELRNDVTLLRLEGVRAAGAIALLDAGARVRRVALVGGAGLDEAQPLLSPLYYLEKALAPFAQLRQPRPGVIDPVGAMLAEKPDALVLADVSLPPGDAYDAVANFVSNGGTLIRFAGPRLANAADDLLPVRLRRNGRVLGGAMSWETPKMLASFDAASPFAGLATNREVTIQRQVLAEPDPGLVDRTWARLDDGTPLVTAERRGKGMIVLFHVNAETGWSNLPISGLFVEMLRRVAGFSAADAPASGTDADGVATTSNGDSAALPPLRLLDGFGALGAPGPRAQPIASDFVASASAEHPPGFYGAGETTRAVQPLASTDTLATFDFATAGLAVRAPDVGKRVDFRGPLLAGALVAFLVDTLATLVLSGRLRLRPALVVLGALFIVGAALDAHPVRAEGGARPTSQRGREAALKARLAYVVSGDRQVDETARAGLEALSAALTTRTSFAPAEPAGVDPATDELAFYPILYWPIVASAPQPSAIAAAKASAYMKQGGTIVFDTRDALAQRPGGDPTPEGRWLREFTRNLDIPELETVPRDHVITKTFYLLDSFVGRYANGETWVEALPPEPEGAGAARPVRATDSVSAIVVTSNDLAAAWAQNSHGQPLYPLTPGGARQREMALRGGVNLVMYTLTGNYKSDQVHVRDLLERLGQ